MPKLPLILLLLSLFLSSCVAKTPDQSALPSYREVAMRLENPTDKQLLDRCIEKGGKYEVWDNDDGSKSTYCILPGGYGCDPIQLFQGTCSVGF